MPSRRTPRPSWATNQCFQISVNGSLCQVQVLCVCFQEQGEYDAVENNMGSTPNTWDISEPRSERHCSPL